MRKARSEADIRRAATLNIRSDNIAAGLTFRNVRALRLSLRLSVACDLCHNHFAGLSWTSRSVSAKVLQNDTVRVGDSLSHKPGLWRPGRHASGRSAGNGCAAQ